MSTHKIQSGETLSQIAKQYGITVEQLQEANNIEGENLIFAGKTLEIPVENEDAFKNMDGWNIEKNTPQGQIRTVYAYVQPKDENPFKPVKIEPVYAFVAPQDKTRVEPGKIVPEPVYAYVQPKDPNNKNRELIIKTPIIKNLGKWVFTASAKDYELLKKHGASKTINDPNGNAQFITGNANNEYTDLESILRPETLSIEDNTNGNKNTYTYRKITPDDINAGYIIDPVTQEKITLPKDQFKDGETYYVLIEATREDGTDIMKHDHLEIYRLETTIQEGHNGEPNTVHYELIQEEGMSGSGRSSIDYPERKK